MSQNTKHHSHHPLIRWLWKPATAGGAGGAVKLIWSEEILLFGADILALITIPVLTQVVYPYNILVFKARKPRRVDLYLSPIQKGSSI